MLLWVFCLIFLSARPALANVTAGPFTFFPIIILVPILILIASLAGGVYGVLGVIRGKKAKLATIGFIVLCIAVLIVSLTLYTTLLNPYYEYGVLGVALAIIVFAVIRGVRMYRWGFQKRKGVTNEYLRDAKPTRLIINGLWLIVITLCIAAYNGYIFIYEKEVEEMTIKQFEVRENFAMISEYEESYFDTNHTYISDIDAIEHGVPLTSNYYTFEIVYADDMGFLAIAWANMDDDEFWDIWIVTEDHHEPFTYMSDFRDSDYSEYFEMRDVYRDSLNRFIDDISTGEG